MTLSHNKEESTMSVFKIVLTMSVISISVFGQDVLGAAWSYPVNPPIKPNLIAVKYLNNPSVGEIQNAIQPRTRIEISGTVNASSGQRINVNKDDVRLNFKNADVVNWSGNDNWGGFIEVGSSRVQIMNLKMKVVSNTKCRGVVLHSPASDVRFSNCTFENIADGFIADGNFARIEMKNVSFLNCGDWPSSSMEGGYGIFFEEDDADADHVKLDNVEVTLSNSSGQHGIRVSKLQRLWIEDSFFGANAKRSFWAYGVDYVTIKDTTFDHGSVLFNLKTHELQTERASRYVRMDNCTINHSSILKPLAIYCGKGTRYFWFRDLNITSTTSPQYLEVGWRSDDVTRKINWYEGSVTFNGQPMYGLDGTAIYDWNEGERTNLKIGPIDDPRN